MCGQAFADACRGRCCSVPPANRELGKQEGATAVGGRHVMFGIMLRVGQLGVASWDMSSLVLNHVRALTCCELSATRILVHACPSVRVSVQSDALARRQ